jgi:hypothetical protein
LIPYSNIRSAAPASERLGSIVITGVLITSAAVCRLEADGGLRRPRRGDQPRRLAGALVSTMSVFVITPTVRARSSMTGIPPIRYRAKIAAASFTVLSHPTVRTFLVMTLLTDTVTPLTDRRLSAPLRK